MNPAFEKRLQAIIDWLRQEYSSIRAGQASPALLDSVKAESYGTFMPIAQLGSVSVEDARTLRISPWDASTVTAIERAITEADLGVSVATDSSGLRIAFPELTSERREQLKKLAKSKLEDARVSVRTARDDVMKDLEKQQKDGDISEDEKFRHKERIQKAVDATNQKLEEIFASKETEIQK